MGDDDQGQSVDRDHADGDVLHLLDDGDPAATAALEAETAGGAAPKFDKMMAAGGEICRWMTSVTFSGSDLRRVHLGGLLATSIPYFDSPIAGLPIVHW